MILLINNKNESIFTFVLHFTVYSSVFLYITLFVIQILLTSSLYFFGFAKEGRKG